MILPRDDLYLPKLTKLATPSSGSSSTGLEKGEERPRKFQSPKMLTIPTFPTGLSITTSYNTLYNSMRGNCGANISTTALIKVAENGRGTSGIILAGTCTLYSRKHW